MSAEDRARIREYGQIKRYSPGVYEMDSEPLTDEWSAYNQVRFQNGENDD